MLLGFNLIAIVNASPSVDDYIDAKKTTIELYDTSGSGSVKFVRSTSDYVNFEFSISSPNLCTLRGTIINGRGIENSLISCVSHKELGYEETISVNTCPLSTNIAPDNISSNQRCIVNFSLSKEGSLDVNISEEHYDVCHQSCGANTTFIGSYRTDVALCNINNLNQVLTKSKVLHSKKQYNEALHTLLAITNTCIPHTHSDNYEKTLWVKSDLAYTYYRLKDYSKCVETSSSILQDICYHQYMRQSVCYDGEEDLFLDKTDTSELSKIYRASAYNKKNCENLQK